MVTLSISDQAAGWCSRGWFLCLALISWSSAPHVSSMLNLGLRTQRGARALSLGLAWVFWRVSCDVHVQTDRNRNAAAT